MLRRRALLLDSLAKQIKAVLRSAQHRRKAVIHIAEFQILQQRACLLTQRGKSILRYIRIHRCLRADGRQLLRQQRRLFVICQLRLQRFAGNLVDILQHRLHVAIFLNQLERSLRPYARHAGNIIRGIAHQSLQLNKLLRHQAFIICGKLGLIKNLDIADAALRIINLRARIHKLQLVAVARNDDNLHILRRMHSKGADDVICLVVIKLQRRNAHRAQHLHRQRELLAQLARRRLTLPLVIFVQLCTEGFA